MPAYREQLSDEQVAAVVSFVRRSWGNGGSAVQPGTVRAIRRDTHAASLDVAPLPTR
jgi:mono/diheme cytochrome c family protein